MLLIIQNRSKCTKINRFEPIKHPKNHFLALFFVKNHLKRPFFHQKSLNKALFANKNQCFLSHFYAICLICATP